MDESDREVGVFGVAFKAVIEGLLFIKWDDRQEGASHQAEVLGSIDSAVTVVVFDPETDVLSVVVFVFHRPVGSRLLRDLSGLLCRVAAEKVAIVGFDFQVARLVRFFEFFPFFFFEVDPFAAHEGGALGSG